MCLDFFPQIQHHSRHTFVDVIFQRFDWILFCLDGCVSFLAASLHFYVCDVSQVLWSSASRLCWNNWKTNSIKQMLVFMCLYLFPSHSTSLEAAYICRCNFSTFWLNVFCLGGSVSFLAASLHFYVCDVSQVLWSSASRLCWNNWKTNSIN